MSDFTNTFRTLSLVSRSSEFTGNDELALENLVSNCAPLEHIVAQNKPKYSPQAILKIKELLETSPNSLLIFGLDPE